MNPLIQAANTPPAQKTGALADSKTVFLKLFMAHEQEIRAFIASIVNDRHAVDDIFQEVAIVLWQNFGKYDPAKSFGAWGRGIASHKIMHHWRKIERNPVVFSPEAIEGILAGYDRTEIDFGGKLLLLEKCLKQLTSRSQELISLRYREELSLHALAEKVRQSFHAVEKALIRIRASLYKCIQGHQNKETEYE
jgi:RNA polymerase sigma-70 factor, ECF subfamily